MEQTVNHCYHHVNITSLPRYMIFLSLMNLLKIYMHKLGVLFDDWMFIVDSYIGYNIAKVCKFVVQYYLFQQSVHIIPLDWNSFSISWYCHIYWNTPKGEANGCSEKNQSKEKENELKTLLLLCWVDYKFNVLFILLIVKYYLFRIIKNILLLLYLTINRNNLQIHFKSLI